MAAAASQQFVRLETEGLASTTGVVPSARSPPPRPPPGLLARALGWNRVRSAPGQELAGADQAAAAAAASSSSAIKSRVLFVNDVQRTHEYARYVADKYGALPYCANAVRSSKYSALNFLPKSLFEQFRRIANFYFLVISLLQLCTDLSPTNEYSTVGPLAIVLVATMVKEGWEDRRRHQQDNCVNHERVEVLGATAAESADQSSGKVMQQPAALQDSGTASRSVSFQPVFWKSVRVGHIVKVYDRAQVPADIWNRVAPENGVSFGTSLHAEIRCELPNKRLYSFDGVLRIAYASEQAKREALERQARLRPSGATAAAAASPSSSKPPLSATLPDVDELPISIENVMLRGMKLCNTKWVVGVVVGAGNDTKLMQNMKAIPSKFSRLDHTANRCILLIFAVLFALCGISAVQASLFAHTVHARQGFGAAPQEAKAVGVGAFFEAWITYLILYNNMVPISLYISLEVVKWYQARRIENDPKFRCADNGHGVTARTGLVAATTESASRFPMGGPPSSASSGAKHPSSGREGGSEGRRIVKQASLSEKDVRPYYHLLSMVEHPTRYMGKEQHSLELARPFFRCLLLCHSASVAIEENARAAAAAAGRADDQSSSSAKTGSDGQPLRHIGGATSLNGSLEAADAFPWTGALPTRFERKYFGSSPDEVALLNAAMEFNCVYEEREGDLIRIKLFGNDDGDPDGLDPELAAKRKQRRRQRDQATAATAEEEKKDSLAELEKALASDSESGRDDSDSPFDAADEEILVFSKGADTVMFANAANAQDISKLGLHVHYFAAMALRTLLLGFKALSKAEYLAWKSEYNEARKSLSDREHKCLERSKMIIIKGKNKQDCLDEIANARRKLKREGVWVPGVATRNMSLVINGEALEFLLVDAVAPRRVRLPDTASHAKLDVLVEERELPSNSGGTLHASDSASIKSAGSFPLQFHGSYHDTSPAAPSGRNQRVSSRHSSTRASLPENSVPHPYVYRSSLKQSELSLPRLSLWVLNALLHSLLVFFFATSALSGISSPDGHANGLFTDGTVVYGAMVITVTLRASLAMQRLHRWGRFHYLSLFGGFTVFLVFVAVYSRAYGVFPTFDVFRDFDGIADMLFAGPTFWLLILFTTVASLAPDVALLYLKQMYLPSSNDIIQEIDSGLGHAGTFDAADFSIANLRGAKFTEGTSSRFEEQNLASPTPSGRSELTASLLDGEWSQKFRDFDRPTEHDELSKQLVALQRELAQEIGLPDPMLNEDDAQSSRALNVQPSVHPLTLEFMGEEHQTLESEYELTFALRERLRIIFCLKILACVIPLYALYEYFLENEASYVWIRAGFFLCDVVYMRVARTKFFIENYQSAILLPYCAVGMALTLTISDTGTFAAALYPIGLFVVIRVKFLYALLLSVYNCAFYLLADKIGIKSQGSQDLPGQLLFALYLAFVITFGAYSCYSLQITMRRDFLQSRSLLLEQKRSTQILKNMLPEHVVQRMQKGDSLISEDEKDVTILFCDIADFASFVTRFAPTEVVSLLDRVYSLFDQICHKHGVRKMETVGKTYMACAGLQGKDRGKEAALRAVSMAIDMLTTLDKCTASNGNGIKLRIGIHSGRVVSGLVGMKKQQFSLFGDTVNTASRMQSTGITGRCQVSQVTYKKLAGHFSFEERQVEVKGKGAMTTYTVGEPLSELARTAVLGQLEHMVNKRESLIMSEHNGRRAFDSDFISVTRQKIVQRAKKRWAKYDPIRLLLGAPPSTQFLGTAGGSSSAEEDMLSEIRAWLLYFNEDELERKYMESTLADRVEGARTTLVLLALYAFFTCMRDLTLELLQSATNSGDDDHDAHISASMYAVILLLRSVYAAATVLLARRARAEFPDFSEFKLRNVLIGEYLVGLCCFTLSEALLWRRNYVMEFDTSPRYVNLCLDTVLAMFVVSNGGSILHRHTVAFNALALAVVTVTSLISLEVFHQDAQQFNSNFKTSYPLVLTYLSVITNFVASNNVEFFTRRQIWLKTRTQLETMNADRLLYQMLPAAVVMRLKEGETVCDQHQQVGILFSDIRGFTSIASQADTAQVVNILASLFCAFDKLTEKHGVFKMQTIGDAYVIVSGLPYVDMSLGPVLGAAGVGGGGGGGVGPARGASSRVLPLGAIDQRLAATERSGAHGALARRSTLKHKFQMHIRSHIRDLLAMARDMHKEVCKVQDPNTGERLQMRIGIHIGNIIGGVIGTTTLRYDMWGPDALTANELESNGVPERTLVSPLVMEVVKGMPDIRCTFHKKAAFTNVSLMDTYLVDFVEPPSERERASAGGGSHVGSGPIGRVNADGEGDSPKSVSSLALPDEPDAARLGEAPSSTSRSMSGGLLGNKARTTAPPAAVTSVSPPTSFVSSRKLVESPAAPLGSEEAAQSISSRRQASGNSNPKMSRQNTLNKLDEGEHV
ncbi:hypothetical protein PybrP1_002679 [[Pythium] brassicae (nom. inval.)]|nr:hypothetical protein PybrP1_002679 [[Pythium] brassicae (nom. inval.)]